MKRLSYLLQISKNIGSNPVFLYGPRGAGKSVIAQDYCHDCELVCGRGSARYFDLEKCGMDDVQRALSDSLVTALIIDEVRNIAEVESVLKLLAVRPIKLLMVSSVLTAANIKSAELPLTPLRVLPLSFAEYLCFKNIYGAKGVDSALKDYLIWGGMPEVVRCEESKRLDLLSKVYRRIISDLAQGPNSLNSGLTNDICLNMLSKIGLRYSAREAHSDDPLVGSLMKLEDSGLFDRLPPKKIAPSGYGPLYEKYYFFDHGLANLTADSCRPDMKQRIENIVFYELRRRGYQVFNGISSLYSVDFIAI